MAMRWKRRAASLAMLLWAGAAAAQTAPAAAPANPGPAAAAAAPAAAAPATPSASAFPIPPDVGAAPSIEPPKTRPAKPKRQAVAPAPPLETALVDRSDADPAGRHLFRDAKAAERYAAIVAGRRLAERRRAAAAGRARQAVAKLRKRLGDRRRSRAGRRRRGRRAGVWDADLTAAVKRFQARMGLRETGVVAGATLKAINVPAEVRAHAARRQRAAACARSTFAFGERYVVVNLPSTSVEAVENGRVAHRYVAIVGDPEHPSPEIAAHISVINLNPTWTVPVSIIKKEIIPQMQRDPGYLTRAKIRILDGSGAEIDPKSIDWTHRARGQLHVAPGFGRRQFARRDPHRHAQQARRLHARHARRSGCSAPTTASLSHGCVRVQGVYDYAEWLLQGTPDGPGGVWDKAALLAKVKDGARERHQARASRCR